MTAVRRPPARARLRGHAVLVPLLAVLCVGLFVLSLAEPTLLYAAFGVTATTIIAVPMLLSPRFDLFSPWSFLFITTFFGCGLRGAAMSAGWPDPRRISDMLIFGMNPTDMLFPGGLLLCGCLLMVVGYFVLGPRLARRPLRLVDLPLDSRFRGSVLLLTALSFSSTFLYVTLTNEGSSAISAKRAKITDRDVAGNTDVQQHGILVHASRLAVYALLLVLAVPWFGHGRQTLYWRGMLGVLFLLGLALPFYSSQRLGVMWTCMAIAAAVTYTRGRVPVPQLAMLSSVCVCLYFVMAVLRAGGVERARTADENLPPAELFLSKLIVHRNFLGVSKTANIINSVPQSLPFDHGRSIYVWAIANVPRSAWPDKPLVHCGPIIGTDVYGNRVSGVPPGLVAELYWNFGPVGVLAGCLAFGAILRFVYETLAPHNGGGPANILLYVVGPMRLAFDASGNSIGYGLNAAALNAATMAVVLLAVGRRRRDVAALGSAPAPPPPRWRRLAA